MGSKHSLPAAGGYRVMKVSEDSPASCKGLEIFFDYIVQMNNVQLIDASRKTYEEFIETIKDHENKSVQLHVYNCRYDETRVIQIEPKRWKGNGLLGININFEPFTALNEGARVLDVLKNSPAYNSKLSEYTDYIIGYDNGIFRNKEEVLNYVNMSYLNQMKESGIEPVEIILFVYNSKSENIRRVSLQLSNNWGGEGLLGCNIANGILHKIPNVQKKKDSLLQKIESTNPKEGNTYEEEDRCLVKEKEGKNEEPKKNEYNIIITKEEKEDKLEEQIKYTKEEKKGEQITEEPLKDQENKSDSQKETPHETYYEKYSKQMQTYTDELNAICEVMNKNSEILSNMGFNTKKILVEGRQDISKEKNNKEEDQSLEYDNEDSTNKQKVDEKKEIKKNCTDDDTTLYKANHNNNNPLYYNIDLLINDVPKAGIIYPTTDLT